jgi:ATP-dependent RNA helicase SUPV3L1/SUV3
MENTKDGMFKIDSDMMNLIGCSKENFLKLLDLMQYKSRKNIKESEEFFTYKPKFIKINNKRNNKNDAFRKLSELRLT